MSLALYYHPFSSYSQKAEIAFYQKGIAFEAKLLDGSDPVQSDLIATAPRGGWCARTCARCGAMRVDRFAR